MSHIYFKKHTHIHDFCIYFQERCKTKLYSWVCLAKSKVTTLQNSAVIQLNGDKLFGDSGGGDLETPYSDSKANNSTYVSWFGINVMALTVLAIELLLINRPF